MSSVPYIFTEIWLGVGEDGGGGVGEEEEVGGRRRRVIVQDAIVRMTQTVSGRVMLFHFIPHVSKCTTVLSMTTVSTCSS